MTSQKQRQIGPGFLITRLQINNQGKPIINANHPSKNQRAARDAAEVESSREAIYGDVLRGAPTVHGKTIEMSICS